MRPHNTHRHKARIEDPSTHNSIRVSSSRTEVAVITSFELSLKQHAGAPVWTLFNSKLTAVNTCICVQSKP
eukprot:13446-Heterococcus_DN1.PRE.2